jgi:protein-S-isoprenylcysteine O-methyltransferase Ste14
MTEPTVIPPSLARRSLVSLAVFAVALAAMLFLPAGSLTWAQGWLFWAVFLLCCLVVSLYFLKHDPALVARRIDAGPTAEKQASQKRIQSVASVLVIAMFVVPGFDRRFGWSHMPWTWVLIGDAMVIAGFWSFWLVFRTNTFAAATVGVAAGQKVISTGVYGVVRHPMYAGAVVLFVGCALGLGSWWTLIAAALTVPLLAWRLTDEEAYLVQNLPGYEDYRRKVRWRLLPLVW